jgi:hypothetical protein
MGVLDENSKTFLRQMDQDEVLKEFWPDVKKGNIESFVWRKGQADPYPMSVDYDNSEATKFSQLVIEVEKKLQALFQENFNNITVFLKFKIETFNTFMCFNNTLYN